MTDLAERTSGSVVVDRATPSRRGMPPTHRPPEAGARMPAWPFSAKLVTAILIVAAVLGAIGTVVGFTSDGDPTADLEAQVLTLTTERDALAAQLAELDTRIATVTVERDTVASELAELDAATDVVAAQRDQLVARLAALDTTLSAVTVERDDLTARLTELDETFATLTADIAELDESVDVLVAERDQLEVDRADLQAELDGAIANLRAVETDLDAAVTERDALAALFPMTFDADLADVDLVGAYDVDATKVYCDGFTTCASLPAVDELEIVETTNGYLRLEMDGFMDAGLYRVDGSLYAIADSSTAVPACGTVPRTARITVTIYPHGLTVADDGTYAIDDLGASITIQSAATGTCPAGLAFHGAQLTPQ